MSGTTHFKGNLDVGGNLTVGSSTNSGSFKLPSLTTTQRNALTAEAGMHVYDSTLGVDYIYRGSGGWGTTGGSAAASLDAAYNGGATVTVDAGAVTLTDSQTTTGGGLLITKSGVVTGANSASVFHINSSGAHDTSGALKIMEISVGTETVSGGVYGIEIEMNANDDYGIAVTKGAVVLTDGALTLTSGALTLTSGNFTMTSGNADITGTLAVSGATTIGGALTGQGALTLDLDSANALKVRRNGTSTTLFNIDSTSDAGDTTFTLVSETTSGIGASLTIANTTGQGLYIDGSTVTSGDVVQIKVVSGTMTAAGSAISVIDGATEVFAVRDDGSVYSKSTAEGTTGFEIAAGDLKVTDGDLNVAAGETALTDAITTSGIGVAITSTATTAGVGAGTAGPVVLIANSLTTGTALVVRADAVTTGDMLYLDAGGATMTAGSGFFINCNDDNASKFTVSSDGRTVIAGTAAGTAALTLTLGDLVISDTDASTISSADGVGTLLTLDNVAGVIASDTAVLLIDAGGAVASGGNLLRIAPTGTPNAGAIGIEFVGASKTCQAMYIDSDPTGVDVVHVNGGGNLTDGFAVLGLTNDGTLGSGGGILHLTTGGTPNTGAIAFEITSQKDCFAMYVDSDAATNHAVNIVGSGNLADNKAMLAVSSDATGLIAGSSLVRIEDTGSAAGASATVYGLEIAMDGTYLEGLYVSAGTSLFAEAVTFTAGAQSSGVARTATADGLTTGTIAAGTSFVTATGGANANCWFVLPTPVVGNILWISPTTTTGYEIRTNQPKTVMINGGKQTDAESAVATGKLIKLVCTSATTWVGSQYTRAGTESPVQVAAT